MSLSENHAEHIENWRAHLKHERDRCNRSFARLVFWLTVNSSRNFFGTLEFAGRSQDCDVVYCCLALLDEAVWFYLRAEPKPTTNRLPARFRIGYRSCQRRSKLSGRRSRTCGERAAEIAQFVFHIGRIRNCLSDFIT